MRKAAPARDIPPPLEMLCLKALWSLQEANVKDVQRALADTRCLAYTTVMTLLERLVRKGAVARRKAGRAFVYSPQVTRETVQRRAVKEFLDLHFDGSEEDLVAFLRDRRPPAAPEPAETRVETTLDAVLL
jgi:BlaI family transcriptional regulator, penicillinase repressor